MIMIAGLIPTFMSSQPRKQTITIHILLSITRNKGNQAIKFGQLTGYNVRNVLLP